MHNSKTECHSIGMLHEIESPVPEGIYMSWKEDMNSVIKKEGYSG